MRQAGRQAEGRGKDPSRIDLVPCKDRAGKWALTGLTVSCVFMSLVIVSKPFYDKTKLTLSLNFPKITTQQTCDCLDFSFIFHVLQAIFTLICLFLNITLKCVCAYA